MLINHTFIWAIYFFLCNMLRENDKIWIEEAREAFPKSVKRRQYDARIRNKARKALQDLAYLAEHLDYSQHRQIFHNKSFNPLMIALLEYSLKIKPNAKGGRIRDETLFKLFSITAITAIHAAFIMLPPDIQILMSDNNGTKLDAITFYGKTIPE